MLIDLELDPKVTVTCLDIFRQILYFEKVENKRKSSKKLVTHPCVIDNVVIFFIVLYRYMICPAIFLDYSVST